MLSFWKDWLLIECSIMGFPILLLGLFFIMVNFGRSCYITINEEGLFINEFKFYKKSILWDAEIYYQITDKFLSLYSYKKMTLLGDNKIVNDQNIKDGYLSFKTKNALKTMIDNKDWICIPTRWLNNNRLKMTKNVNFIKKFTFFGRLVREPTGFLNKSNIQVDDIVDIINNVRKKRRNIRVVQ
jgi:hypothetical protein